MAEWTHGDASTVIVASNGADHRILAEQLIAPAGQKRAFLCVPDEDRVRALQVILSDFSAWKYVLILEDSAFPSRDAHLQLLTSIEALALDSLSEVDGRTLGCTLYRMDFFRQKPPSWFGTGDQRG